MSLRVVAAAAASVALHALLFWAVRRTRSNPLPAPAEPVLVEVLPAERPTELKKSPPTRGIGVPGRSRGNTIASVGRSAPRSSAKPQVETPSEAPAPHAPLDLGLHTHIDPLPNPGVDPKAAKLPAPPPMETPGADMDSVMEFKRGEERKEKVPEVWAKLFGDHGEPKPDYKVKPQRDGGRVYHDERADRFDARLNPDGTLSFDDHHVHARGFKEQWRNWVHDPLHNPPPLPSLIFDFDVTDEVMRARNQDPYSAVKRKLIDGTLEERQRIYDDYRRETMQAAISALRPFLRALVTDPSRSLDEKRRLLGELRDECDDTPGGRIARGIIVEFIDQLGNR